MGAWRKETKRSRLFDWAVNRGWFYLNQVPFDNFNMSRQEASTALISLKHLVRSR
jgi:hypothetical protein